MTNFWKKYLTGLGIFLTVLFIAANIGKISYFNIGRQSAAVLDLVTANGAKPAYGFAWNENTGWINFGTSTESTEGQAYVSNNKLYGYAWGENVGWISLNCENDNSCSAHQYGVAQDNTNGILTGYAWGENVGWIDFAPAGGGVTISTSTHDVNTFSGYAWGENIGWISFSGAGYGVSTAWTKPGGGGGPVVTNLCTYQYSDWTICQYGQQQRTVLSQSSTYCSNSSDPLTQNCVTATSTATTTLPLATSSIKISLAPTSTEIFAGDTFQFSAIVTGTTTNNGVSWLILPIETIIPDFYGHIDNTGLYFAPMQASGTINVTIKATAHADPAKSAFAEVVIRLATSTATTTIPLATSTATTTLPEITSTSTATSTSDVTASSSGNGTDNAADGVTSSGIINNNSGSNSGNSAGLDANGIISALNISGFVANNAQVLGTTTEKIILGAQKIASSPVGSAVTKTITTAGVVGGGVAASGVLAVNSTAMTDLFFLPFKLWGLLLSALGLRKRNRPWGTVYDSVTKQPIDPAYVTLKKIHGKSETTSITDLDGRYGFLVSPGKYTLIANKTNYTFPSKKLSGKTSDVLYDNLYFGGEINIKTADALINKNIPLDPAKFDWNEFVKGKKKLMKFYSQREKLIRIATDWIFRLGFIISLISLFLVNAPYNLIIFGLYILLVLLRKFGLKQKALGALKDKNNNPLSFAIVRVFSPDLNIEITNKVADKIGRYFCLVPRGKYYVKVEKKNDDESYSPVHTSEVFEAENGIVNKNFVI